MSVGSNPIERLDLRFRTVPTKSHGFRLPGGTWLWFSLGLIAGTVGWAYGHRRIAEQLSQSLGPDSTTAEALLALEALNVLDPWEESQLARGLAHPDSRVARSAMDKINGRIQGWQQLDSTLHFAAMQALADQLDKLPKDLPEENRTLICGLAARLYSSCIAINDPQLQPVSNTCLRLLSVAGAATSSDESRSEVTLVRAIPPEPLPRLRDMTENHSTLVGRIPNNSSGDSQSPASPGVVPLLIETRSVRNSSDGAGNPARLPATSNPVNSSAHLPSAVSEAGRSDAREGISDSSGDSLDDRGFSFPSESPRSDPSHATSEQTKMGPFVIGNSTTVAEPSTGQSHGDPPVRSPGSQVMVATPASIVSHPVVRMKVVSDQPNFEGIQNAEIAELVRLLSNNQADVAKAAALALRHKGFSDTEIELASELAVGSALRRIELIQKIARSSDITPQPWLVWMAEDGQPEVRRMAISMLSSMLTEEVQRSLRMLMFRESEPEIKDLIRKVLLSSSR